MMLLRRRPLLTGTVSTAAATTLWLSGADAEYDVVREDALPRAYDPAAIDAIWSAHPRVALARVGTVTYEAAPLAARVAVEWARRRLGARARGDDGDEAQWDAARARELRETLTRLGPTFIKFGQMLSIRPDVVPACVLDELRQLCDAVPPFPTRDARATVAAELGVDDAANVFDGFGDDAEPVAAASLGQVYRVRLDGKDVALKVQRPDMIRAVSLDLFLLRRYAVAVECAKAALAAAGVLAPRRAFDVALVETFARASYRELDYEHEAANQRRFAAELPRALPARDAARVRVPAVLASASARKVLTTEWIVGEQLARQPRDVVAELTPLGVRCFIAQLLDLGFFHSDPHPGNLLVDDATGALVLIDFGLCAEVARPDARAMTRAIVHLMDGDVDELLRDATHLGFLPPDMRDEERAALARATHRVLTGARLALDDARDAADAAGAPVARGSKFVAVARTRKQFAAVSRELNAIFFEFPFTVPEYFALITRALLVLEGIALSGIPEFDIFQAAYPHALARASAMSGELSPEDVRRLVAAASRAAAREASAERRRFRRKRAQNELASETAKALATA